MGAPGVQGDPGAAGPPGPPGPSGPQSIPGPNTVAAAPAGTPGVSGKDIMGNLHTGVCALRTLTVNSLEFYLVPTTQRTVKLII